MKYVAQDAPHQALLAETPGLAVPASPFGGAVGQHALQAYEQAMAKFNTLDREATLMRLEVGYQYAEIAADLGITSANAARMRIDRAVSRLAEIINVEKLRA